jgi:SAM-dependent methyltransferase
VGLEHVRAVFEKAGREDPMYAVLTDHSRRGNKWNPEEFFRAGRDEIESVMAYVREKGWAVGRDTALDFGSGVGRLTQALAAHFDRVTGVDISSSMVAEAARHNSHGARVSYLQNSEPNLSLLGDASFDFVYSSITLQHIPPDAALAYMGEFIRVLKPGGIAIFQAHNGPRIEPGTFRAWLYRLRREHWRRFWQRVRGRIGYEMHFVARVQVEAQVRANGGRILDVVDLSRDRGSNYRYAVTR